MYIAGFYYGSEYGDYIKHTEGMLKSQASLDRVD